MGSIISFSKKHWRYIIVAIIAMFIGSASGPSETAMSESTETNMKLIGQVDELKDKNKESATKIAELEAKVAEAAPWFKMKDDERKQQEAEAKAAEEKRLADEKAKAEAEAAAKAAAEAEAKRLAEEEAKKGYDTGITYNQLARTPDDFIGKKVKFQGKVVQVIEGDTETQIRMAVNDDYDTILFAAFDKSVVSSRVLEDDVITIMGLSSGLITYESTMGGKISIPGVSIDKIEQ
jgi:regulator of protease activity HflC (stomatin/prohibitin superfamily)